MPQEITNSQFLEAEKMRNVGNLEGFYQFFADKGYIYANVAKGIVTTKSTADDLVLGFMQHSAAQQGVQLTKEKSLEIQENMAAGYSTALLEQINTRGVITHDPDATTTLEFHNAGFVDAGLNPSTWAMYAPFTIMGDGPVREQYWKNFLIAQDSLPGVKETFFAGLASGLLKCSVACVDPTAKAQAAQWVENMGLGAVDRIFYLLTPSPNIFEGIIKLKDIKFSDLLKIGGDVDINELAEKLADLEIPAESTMLAAAPSELDASASQEALANATDRAMLIKDWTGVLSSHQDATVSGIQIDGEAANMNDATAAVATTVVDPVPVPAEPIAVELEASSQAAAEAPVVPVDDAVLEAQRVADEQATARIVQEAADNAAREAQRIADEQAAARIAQEAADNAASEAQRIADEQAAARIAQEAADNAAREAQRVADEQAAATASNQTNPILSLDSTVNPSVDNGRYEPVWTPVSASNPSADDGGSPIFSQPIGQIAINPTDAAGTAWTPPSSGLPSADNGGPSIPGQAPDLSAGGATMTIGENGGSITFDPAGATANPAAIDAGLIGMGVQPIVADSGGEIVPGIGDLGSGFSQVGAEIGIIGTDIGADATINFGNLGSGFAGIGSF